MKKNLSVLITSTQTTLLEKSNCEKSALEKGYEFLSIENDDVDVVIKLSAKAESGEFAKIVINNSTMLQPTTIRDLKIHLEKMCVDCSFF